MVHSLLALNQHVVYIHLHVSFDLVVEHAINQSLICSTGIFKSEGHNVVIVEALTGNKRYLLLILFIHHDLVVTKECIHKLKSSCPVVESTNWSIYGREKLSFKHVLFRLVKSTHILHSPFDFLAMTTLVCLSG